MDTYDFVVIGGGPGGYVAAIRASQLGYSVAIVEKEETLGGVCLNWGCIPTKSLLKSAEVYNTLKSAEHFGFKVGNIELDLAQIVRRSREAVSKLAAGVSSLMKKHNIKVHRGIARLSGNKVVSVEQDKERVDLSAKHIILATGSSARSIPGLDKEILWTAREAMLPETLPESLLIIGTGAIGVEFASFYATLGSKVSMVELQERMLPLEDRAVSEFMLKNFQGRGVDVYTGSSVSEVKCNGPVMETVILGSGSEKKIRCDKIISAVGVQPNTKGLGIENTKIKADTAGFIIVDEYCRTDEPGIYAIGDVSGAPCLAHKASHEATICVDKIAEAEGTLDRKVHPLVKDNIPSCIYSIPQVASVGLTEESARAQGFQVKVGNFPANCSGKAVASGEVEGFVKVVLDETTGELLGAHMVGTEVTEMIHGYVVCKQLEGTSLDIASTVFPHPTLSEMMHEA
ncbi:unnamed protein product, partial [Ixodes pacificus]